MSSSLFDGCLAIRGGELDIQFQMWILQSGKQLDNDSAERWCAWAKEKVPGFVLKSKLQRLSNGFLVAREVNFASNNLGDRGAHAILRTLHSLRIAVRILKLFKNNLGRAAASAMMDFMVATPVACNSEQLSLPPGEQSAFARWAHCFCLFVFDLQEGQRLEFELPSGGLRAAEDLRLLGFLAFPDSAPGRLTRTESAVFGFRFRRGSGVARRGGVGNGSGSGTSATEPGGGRKLTEEYAYGVAYFRQQPDLASSRHCVQRSLVLVSQHPFLGFFTQLMEHVGELFYQYGPTFLESVAHSMAAWPDPPELDSSSSSRTLDLPVAGKVLRFTPPGAAYGGARTGHLDVSSTQAFWLDSAGSSSMRPSFACGLGWPLSFASQAASQATAHRASSAAASAAWATLAGEELSSVAEALGIARCDPSELPRGPAEAQRPFSAFYPLLGSLWLLWERALCGEPLLIFSPDKGCTCGAGSRCPHFSAGVLWRFPPLLHHL
ncbi:unnamed protein product [Polarella glacialis]|uniref:UDENN domain-containing protein n=1 Tax=Polarella glacialis TaxID=89957 RepID=A0A813JGB8_POLGL|nr:unnamed protein product [Polarella glacialis]